MAITAFLFFLLLIEEAGHFVEFDGLVEEDLFILS